MSAARLDAPEAAGAAVDDDIARRTDAYFKRTREVVRRFGDKRVTYAVFLRRPVISAPKLMLDWLERVAAWCVGRGVALQVAAGIDPGGATDLQAIQALRRIEARPGVSVLGEDTLRAVLGLYQSGSVALDLYDASLERRLAVPIRTVNALTAGAPVLTNVESTLSRSLQRAGAAVLAGGEDGALEAALREKFVPEEAPRDEAND